MNISTPSHMTIEMTEYDKVMCPPTPVISDHLQIHPVESMYSQCGHGNGVDGFSVSKTGNKNRSDTLHRQYPRNSTPKSLQVNGHTFEDEITQIIHL